MIPMPIRPRPFFSRFLMLALTAAALAPAAAAFAADTAWRPAPLYAADVRSVVVHPERPQMVFAGTSSGQLYRSNDGGRSWAPAGPDLPFPGWVVSDLRFDPNRPGRLWVALRGIWGGGHVASSDDLGKSWASRGGGLPNEPVYTLALAPGSPGTLYAGTVSGVYGTRDDGATWQPLTAALPEMQKVTSLWVDPAKPSSVIAGTWRRAYKSDDAGQSWNGVFDGMVLDSEVFSLTSSPYRPGELWASTCGWVYRSGDLGGKWERFQKGLSERRTPSFAILPSGRLLAGTVSGLYASDDGGKSWILKSDPALSVTKIIPQGENPTRLILGTEGSGMWLSPDGGESFLRASSGLTNSRVGALAASPKEMLVGINHAGPLSGIYASKDGGATFTGDFTSFPTVLDLAYYGGKAYAATEQGLFERRGTGWHVLMELGESRFEQLIAGPGRLLARTPSAIFEYRGGRFQRLALAKGLLPRSAALWGGALWVSDGSTVLRLAGATSQSTPAPGLGGGRLTRVDDQLVFSGPKGAWAQSAGGEWVQIAPDSSRLLSTGDGRFGALLVSGEKVRLYDSQSRRFRPLEVPFPVRDVVTALVVGNRLLLGTSGYGLQETDLSPLTAAVEEQPPVEATVGQ
jgi:photosystem II stability/assembly factor-like uncharacterized protein